MKVKVDQNACIGCGACVSIDPNIFSFNDEGYAEAIEEDINANEIEKAKEAIENCPTEAISEVEKND